MEIIFVETKYIKKMNNYTYTFETSRSAKEIFELLLTIKKWWSGIHNETITGNSLQLNDEFSFSAGGGMHFSKQKLVELIPDTKIVWLVTESNLSFLDNPTEWENTKLVFNIFEKGGKTHVQFSHVGLNQQIECYEGCSTAWTQYLHNLKNKLNSI
ncbi:Activator of Hsp90 ATPase homolog 1-like protein [Flavobacterium flevense]|uniref:Activator of Hsp90 ATPase homologue 1/2-like C-terminal domain-containing protein n=1 Tax=Flavobacterium flevense TaxID=983 RepID=A0A4Y4AUA0_9FLAO|nr:SRPBCC domain-containing protein [Flavobacterium flevense]GEC70517.1 hypothetical protein FFL01_00560 [Flavobacterium flevense]SHL62580.1 Activator of Hsp90 ATPase homolog 1-like protein [Flavobacterium flevense]